MLRSLLLLVVLAVVGFAGYVAMLPPKFSVVRSITIDAPPATVFSHVNSLKKWDSWSPWAKKDPDAKVAYSGPDEGVGSKFEWSGNDEVGVGEMVITESKPNERVNLGLKIIEPFPGDNPVTFTFEPVGEGTKATWMISGDQPFMERAILAVMQMDMESMIGKEYEKGLVALKKVAEDDAASQKAAAEAKAEADATEAAAGGQEASPVETEAAPVEAPAPAQ